MTHWNRLFAVLMSAVLCFSLSACGGAGEAPVESASPTDSAAASTESVSDTSSGTVADDAAASDVEVTPKKTPENAAPSSTDFAAYDGYAYYLENGQCKYVLELKDGFRMRCYFRSDSPEYYEEVYTIDLNSADLTGDTLTVHTLSNGSGADISDWFLTLSYTFRDGQVEMNVIRDPKTLAGGAEDNVQTGTYLFTAQQPTEKQSTGNSGQYSAEELGSMAQNYYAKHNSFFPPKVECTANDDGTYTIHLYEVVDNGDGTTHTATSAWYTVDAAGMGTDDITGESINLGKD